ncbi:MAG: hypothetical protein CME70_01530 [Halobacteriovorax sp.]|nr:hypothetical protein [Halobacteriovorax sp.]
MAKKKILMLSDHALSPSGVGCQSRFLIEGLIEKGEWSVRQFGAAVRHENYDVITVNDDFIIKPIDGFGNKELIRVTLAAEKPDILFIFTDPRFFTWLWEMEDEVHQICPIVYWHVWDNYPTPKFNKVLYESTDLVNCHSYITYEMCSELVPGKANFIPHALPPGLFYPLKDKEIKDARAQILGPNKVDHFVAFWVNRNAKRKRGNDLLLSWKLFLDELEKTHKHKNATLLLHTDPMDREGSNLFETVDMLGIKDNVVFSKDRIEFAQMNVLHNIADVGVNISYAEGFGLGTLESMQTGTPIIAPKTGGLTRQVVDHRDGTENGVALPIEIKTLVGSQTVPYIYEDYVSCESIAAAFMKMHNLSPKEQKKLSNKVLNYVKSEFSYQTTVDLWHETLNDTVANWKEKYKPWECVTL